MFHNIFRNGIKNWKNSVYFIPNNLTRWYFQKSLKYSEIIHLTVSQYFTLFRHLRICRNTLVLVIKIVIEEIVSKRIQRMRSDEVRSWNLKWSEEKMIRSNETLVICVYKLLFQTINLFIDSRNWLIPEPWKYSMLRHWHIFREQLKPSEFLANWKRIPFNYVTMLGEALKYFSLPFAHITRFV